MEQNIVPEKLFFMKRCLALATTVKGRTFPNPAVGACVVADGKIVGEGATSKAGSYHAEVLALNNAKDKAQNATLYVTLEPCSHHGRTPPCTDAIIRAGVKKVVVAVKDPNPLVSGSGVAKLRNAGISVSIGTLCEESKKLNEDFFWNMQTSQPWVTLKLAMSIDGCIADKSGSSKWITSNSARKYVHLLRSQHAMIAVGSGTVRSDDPQLTVRGFGNAPSPVRVIFSRSGRIPLLSQVRQNIQQHRTIIVSSGSSVQKKVLSDGVELWSTGTREYYAIIKQFLTMAYEEGLSSIFVEGGSMLASSFLQMRLVNRLYVFYGNVFIGDGLRGIDLPAGFMLNEHISLKDYFVKTFDETIMISGMPNWK